MGDFTTLASTAASQHGVLTKHQLKATGLTENDLNYRVRVGRLKRRPGGVFVISGSASTWEQKVCAAALAAASSVGAASHRTAARLYGFRSVDDNIDVTVRYPRKLSIPGARVVRSRDLGLGDVTWVGAIPTTTPERTICDLGLIFPQSEVMRVLRHCVATGMVTKREVLRIRIRISQHGRNGAGITGRCLDAIPELAEQVESGLEVLFLEICRNFGLPLPTVQLPVIASGRLYRLDFAFSANKVFVEIDGVAAHEQRHQIAADGGRQNDLVANGWTPVRFEYAQLSRRPDLVAQILRRILNL